MGKSEFDEAIECLAELQQNDFKEGRCEGGYPPVIITREDLKGKFVVIHLNGGYEDYDVISYMNRYKFMRGYRKAKRAYEKDPDKGDLNLAEWIRKEYDEGDAGYLEEFQYA